MYKLSNEQKGIWTIAEINKNSAWTQLLFKRFRGKVELNKLKATLITFLNLQEQLRTNYIVIDSEVVQVIDQKINLERYYGEYDFSHMENKEQYLEEFLKGLRQKVYRLEKDSLYQLFFIKMSEDECVIAQVFHHAIFDATSIHLFWDQLEKIFNGETIQGICSYIEYTKKQIETNTESMKYFWTSKLKNLPVTPVRLFPLKKVDEKLQKENRLGIYEIEMNNQLVQNVNKFAFQHKLSPLGIYLTALSILVYKHSREKDFCLGTFLSGRTDVIFKKTIGFFVKTLPVRVQINPEESVFLLMSDINNFLCEMYNNQDYPISNIIEDLEVDRSLDGHPLFSIVFNRVVSKDKVKPLKMGELEEIPYHPNINLGEHNEFFNFNLSILLNESKEHSILTFWYKNKYISSSEMKRFVQNFIATIENLICSNNFMIKDFRVINQKEYQRLLYDWNQVEDYRKPDDNIYRCFVEAVNHNRTRIAIVDGGERITYGYLFQKVNELACKILNHGVKENSRIAIVLPKSYLQVVSIFAILKINCSYVPIDISSPLQSVQHIIKDASVQNIITLTEIAQSMAFDKKDCVLLDNNCVDYFNVTSDKFNYTSNCEAYVIYTSGSTGVLKGIAIKHINVIRLLRMAAERMNFSNQDTWTYFHSIAFDFSVWEILGSLLYGGKLIVVNEECRHSAEKFAQLIKCEGVTMLNQTPYTLQTLLNYDPDVLDNVKVTLLSADIFEPEILKEWASKRKQIPRIVNAYGTTETTILVTHHELTYEELMFSNISNIGKAYADTKLYVLDDYMNPVPLGAVGELYVSGPGIAKEYIRGAKNSKTGFYMSPFDTEEPYSMIYKTGDLVYYLENGDLAYVGRNDNQVQLQGCHIELGEISLELRKLPQVRDCVVCKKRIINQDMIVAYIVLKEGIAKDSDQIQQCIKQKLPQYMIPSMFKYIEKIPISSNGKVDITQLTDIIYEKEEQQTDMDTSIEDIIINLWKKYLKKSKFNLTDDFFESGGKSIDVVLIKNELEGVYDINIPITDFYRFKTIRELANHIKAVC